MTVSVAPRVLVLHGHFQNANIFSKRIAALRKHCGKDVEFVFPNAPHILQAADFDSPPPSYEPQSADDKDPLRGWWNADLDKNKAVGIEESLLSLRDFLSAGPPFDGVFGFSQGAALAALLAALLENPSAYPPFLIDGKAPHPPFKFCVSVSGFIPSDPISALVFAPNYATPTLHVIGKNDVIVVEERSWRLVRASTAGRVEVHDGGHFIPSKTSWRNFLRAYMCDPRGEVISPGVGAMSAPNSGSATPLRMGGLSGF